MKDEQAIISMEEYKRLKSIEELNKETIDEWANNNRHKLPRITEYITPSGNIGSGILGIGLTALACFGLLDWGWGWWSLIPTFFAIVSIVYIAGD